LIFSGVYYQETVQFDRTASNSSHMVMINERPHTISTAYEKGHHQRAALSVYTFQPLEQYSSSSSTTGQSSCASSTDKFDRTNNSTPTGQSNSTHFNFFVFKFNNFKLKSQ
jgi:hypothetical protein